MVSVRNYRANNAQRVQDWLSSLGARSGRYLFPSRIRKRPHISTRQYARIVHGWVAGAGLVSSAYGTHSMRRTKPAQIYKKTGNLRAVQLLLGHSKLESTVRYLGIEVEDALGISQRVRPARPSVTRANPCLSSWLSPMLPSGPLAAAAHPRCSPISSFVSSITGATSPRAICSHLACEAEVRSPVAARARNRQPCSGVAAVYYGQSAGALGTPRLWRGSLGRGKLPIRCPMIRIAVLD